MPYDIYAGDQKIKIDYELPRGFIDGAIWIGNLLGSPGHNEIDIVNRHWKSHYKIKGVYPTYSADTYHVETQPSAHVLQYRLFGQDFVTAFDDPNFEQGVRQGAAWLGHSDLSGWIHFA
jgi:hypothetical protein